MADTQPDMGNAQDAMTILKGLIGPALSAFAGLLVRWADDYRRTHRWSWTRVLIETPAIIGFGVIAIGITDYLEIESSYVTGAIAALLGSHGTRGFFDLLAMFTGRRK